MCGEKTVEPNAVAVHKGSPPRVRGEEYASSSRNTLLWITPACAGRSILAHRRACVKTDHPRVCGEKFM